jgi:apolipoprotein N-acyltransferase
VSGSLPFISALLSGGLLALAFPGTGDQGWLAFGALVPLLTAIEGAPWRRAAVLGFVAGLVFWLATISWVSATMARYGHVPWSLATLILLGLAGYLALYWAGFCALLSSSSLRSGALYVVVAASVWVALEFLRTYLFTGVPWNLLGYSQHQNPPLIQVAGITGVYGVSFVVMVVNAAMVRVIKFRGSATRAAAPLGTAVVVLGLAAGYGWVGPRPQDTRPPIPVAVVQGNIDQGVKWDPAWQRKTLAVYEGLTRGAMRARPEFVVWPETAAPFFLREDPRRERVEAIAREAAAYLLVGAPDRHGGAPRNSAFLLGPDGQVLGQYDKRHLVPFGEYVPLKRLLFFVNAVAGGAIGEFAPGGEATVFSTRSARFGVVICYEAIFPAEVREFFAAGADFLVNITNDAWFGRTAAPAQHLAMAVFRAVENRAYLLRAANTGISAIVAPDGRVVQSSRLFAPAVLSGGIFPRTGVTFYTRYGDLFAWGTVAVALVAGLAALLSAALPRWSASPHWVSAGLTLWRSGRGRCGLLLSLSVGVAGILLVVSASPTSAFMHQTSKIRFLEYSPAAFDRARQEGKPVFLLISAVWCYWCKYFEERTLNAEGVSDYLNRSYLNVFVDYDRRPDLVRKYVRGIPMIVLFGPDGRVRQSFAGALKKQDFLAVLTRVEGEIRTELTKVRPAEPAAVTAVPAPSLPVSRETYRQLLEGLARYLEEQADTTHGGFGVGSKAPHGRLLAFLLEQPALTPARPHAAAVEKTLEGILRGLYDPVDGGFFHYATGREWNDPRYEKMLSVNASLTVVFDMAYRLTRNPRYKEVAGGTIAYLLRTLYDAKDGGFYGSQTADLDYYRLPPEARRTARKPPVNRDKIAAANAEAILAFLAVSQTTGRKDLKEAALRSLEFMRRRLLTDKGVYHFYEVRSGRGHLRGQLEANAWAALAFLEGHVASGKAVYRQEAERLLRYALAELFDPARGAFVESNNPDEPGPGPREIPMDANGVMALALVHAHQVTGSAEYLGIGRRVLAAMGVEVKRVLVDEPDATPAKKVADSVFYLRAYGQVVDKP